MAMLSDEQMRPLWTCPSCGKRFVNERNWHSCRVVSLDSLFVGKGTARELFDAFVDAVRTIGPVDLDVSQSGAALRPACCGTDREPSSSLAREAEHGPPALC